jgi:dipeptidyl aminopeptidase/acylaminoacyl peptidase
MTTYNDLERSLRVHFDAQADATVVDGQLDRILDRVAGVGQRPGWAFSERWLPMDTVRMRIAPVPQVPWRLLLVTALAVALAIGALVAGGVTRPTLPGPFGLAGNGAVAYAGEDGAIYVADTATGEAKAIVPGPGNDRPIFSPDGTRIAFLRMATGTFMDIVVVAADGTKAIVVTPERVIGATYFSWSPDSKSIAVNDPGGNLYAYSASEAAPRRTLASRVVVGSGDLNVNVAGLFRPPDGRELLAIRADGGGRIVAIAADGSGERILVDRSSSDIEFGELASAQWSPDGSQVVFAASTPITEEPWHVYVMNADGTSLRQLSSAGEFETEAHPAWSPDGTRIALMRWRFEDRTDPSTFDVRPITVIDVATGAETETGIVSPNGYSSWGWSPDGTGILERGDTGEAYVARVGDAAPQPLPIAAGSALSWQRVAP